MQSCHQIPQNQKQDHKTQTNKNRNKHTKHPKCVQIGTQSALQLFCTITTTSAVMNLSEFRHAASQLGGFRYYSNEMIDECCANLWESLKGPSWKGVSNTKSSFTDPLSAFPFAFSVLTTCNAAAASAPCALWPILI